MADHKEYTCFKQCGFSGPKLSDLYAHYRAEPTHHRLYGHDDYRQRQNKRKKAEPARHLSVVGSKVKIGHEVGFHKNGRQLAKLQAELQAAINESAAKLEKLRFAHELLQSGKVGA